MGRFDHLTKKELVEGMSQNRLARARAEDTLKALETGKALPNNAAARDAFAQSTAKLIQELEAEYEAMMIELDKRGP